MSILGGAHANSEHDRGSADGFNIMTLRCTTCDFSVTARPITAVSLTQAHTFGTGHEISYKGVIQEGLSRG